MPFLGKSASKMIFNGFCEPRWYYFIFISIFWDCCTGDSMG